MCCTLCMALCLCLVGQLFHMLIRPEAFDEAIYTPPAWLFLDKWRWVRGVLAFLTGALLLALLIPLLMLSGMAVRDAPGLVLGTAGTVLTGWGVVRLLDRGAPS